MFIFAHSFGYWCKTLICRDWWLVTIISVMFEFLEYTLGKESFAGFIPYFLVMFGLDVVWWYFWMISIRLNKVF